MLTRATAKAPEQDDLFSEDVTLLFPALLALEGRLLGSAVRQQAVPSALTHAAGIGARAFIRLVQYADAHAF